MKLNQDYVKRLKELEGIKFVEYFILDPLLFPTITQILPLYAISFASTVNPGSDGLFIYELAVLVFKNVVRPGGIVAPTRIWFIEGSAEVMKFAPPIIENVYAALVDARIPMDDA